jgi:hypothetical protein
MMQSAPASFGAALFGHPSAICYYTALHLHEHLRQRVPIGVVSASVGGGSHGPQRYSDATVHSLCGESPVERTKRRRNDATAHGYG